MFFSDRGEWQLEWGSQNSMNGEARRPSMAIGMLTLFAMLVSASSVGWGQAKPGSNTGFDPAIDTLLKVDPSIAGSDEARQAWLLVSRWPASRLIEILNAADVANPVAQNWLRSAIDRMSEQDPFELPVQELRRVAEDTSRKYASRRIALELLEQSDPKLAAAIVETFANDPVAALRRPALADRMKEADGLGKKSPERKTRYLEIFRAARDEDQVRAAAGVLEKDFDHKPDLALHFGFRLNWYVVGPFPNVDEVGFHQAFSPEQLSSKDLNDDGTPQDSLEYDVDGKTLRWQQQTADKDTGELDLNQSLGKEKEVVGYGFTTFHSDRQQPAEIRLRLQNAFKLWLNGELIQSQPIGHTGNSFDQYLIPVTLQPGRNLILVKSCQNKPPMEMEFFDTWHINLRICDRSGTAIAEGK